MDVSNIESMHIKSTYLWIIISFLACQDKVDPGLTYFPKKVEIATQLPERDKLWIFIMAGQSNMAGRGQVEPSDTVSNPRILSIDKNNQWIYAKEPLHFYEPNLTGLDCGLSFAKTLLLSIPSDVAIGLLPCAVGGSSIEQWLADSTHREVTLLSNFRHKVDLSRGKGILKGILWHQGESNANPTSLPSYEAKLRRLFNEFRIYIGNDSLPILMGQLGAFAATPEKQLQWDQLNGIMEDFAKDDPKIAVVKTSDLMDKGDQVHFDTKSQRLLGARYAERFLKIK